jgi:cell division septal protein FtsQ
MSAATGRRGAVGSTAGISAPADKRFKRPDSRPAKRRSGTAKIVRLAVVGALGLVAVVWIGGVVLGSRTLAVSQIAVRGNSRLSASEVERMIGSLRGANILQVDLEAYRTQLLDSPWIASATLWRLLPSTVEVRITERVPMAIARQGQLLYLVDRSGFVIAEYGPRYRDIDLPIVDGLIATPDSAGPVVPAANAKLTADFLDALRARPDLRPHVSQINVGNAHDVVALLDNDPTLLHLGDSKFMERLNTYFSLAPTLAERWKIVESVDLRFDDSVYVRAEGQGTTVPVKTGRE